MYEYKATVLRTVDGDTIDAIVDLGFGMRATFRFRLAGIDTPEVYGKRACAAGPEASAFTARWFAEHPDVTVRTYKGAQSTVGIGDGAFGRWLGAFTSGGDDLATDLRAAGHVAPTVKSRP